MKRHLEFFNTHPYVASPILGVEMALEEQRANGADIDDETIQGVKVGMMGPLAGVGDPIWWGTVRPVLGAFAAGMAQGGSIMGPIIFFVVWDVLRMGFLWYTQDLGYKQGTNIYAKLGRWCHAKDYDGCINPWYVYHGCAGSSLDDDELPIGCFKG